MQLASSGMGREGHMKGFTLIELLVVIAIIGILASVVLASLQTARSKGADAAIKSDIDSARAQAELYYNGDNNTYSGVCTGTATDGTPGIANMVAGANNNGGVAVCNSSATAWALSSSLKSNAAQYWCVDSTGTSTTKSAALGAATNC